MPLEYDGLDTSCVVDIFERICVEQNEIGDLSRRDGTKLVLASEIAGRVDRRGSQCVERLQSAFNEDFELLG
jgi:hypothetical protein